MPHSEEDFGAGKPALGDINIDGATVFLKEVVQGGVHRFTVRTVDKELRLRAPDRTTFDSWISALRAFAADFAEDVEEAGRYRSSSAVSYVAGSDEEND